MKKNRLLTKDISPLLEEELELCHRSKAPKSLKSCMEKFIYNDKYVNKESLKEIVSKMELDSFVNVNKIFLLTESEIEESEYDELLMCDTEGLLYDEKLAIHNLETGSIVINLNAHFQEDGLEYSNREVIISLLHEMRHAQQFKKDHEYYPHILEVFARKISLGGSIPVCIDDMEEDAEDYAQDTIHSIMTQVKSKHLSKLVNWTKVNKESLEV